jgi:hypothetical protein
MVNSVIASSTWLGFTSITANPLIFLPMAPRLI